MPRCVSFEMHIKGAEKDQEKFKQILNNITRIQDFELEKKENNVSYINGWATADISHLFFENDENNIINNTKELNLDCEWFESDPGEPDEISHYLVSNGVILKQQDLPCFIFAEGIEDILEDESQLEKYHKEQWEDNEVYVLNKEFLPDAQWDDDCENLICNFEIK